MGTDPQVCARIRGSSSFVVTVAPLLALFHEPTLLSISAPPPKAPPHSSLGTHTLGCLTRSLPKEPGSPPAFSDDSSVTTQQHI